MKQRPEMQDLKVPDSVYVNMHNGSDYVKVPVANLDTNEIENLLVKFMEEFVQKAGYQFRTLKFEII